MTALAAAKSLSDTHCLDIHPIPMNDLFTVDERLLESRGNTLLLVGSVT
jgi:hypothetical protein